ncbi:HAD-IA family hydrolase [Sphingomonas panacisoli]|uniref:phosphoglycolate phosphatase n=1 Tax=Sphingomonas panacisoli TaxID=1813879 RepID=A0A5B8LFV6_9SPHN|nr:HAD-IA family hydrolase [Sphingomonas panacisoli]QDZ07128.1 HAD-IA family hydrolase [Sphingomonas panacisoli]
MADFPFDIVGFDLDGTLVDSAGDLAAAVNHALAAAARTPFPVERIRPMIGGGARLMLQTALKASGGDERLDDLLPILLAYYEANIAVTTRPFPGVLAALDALADRGVTLAIVTNKRQHFTDLLLRELDLTGRFAFVISGDTIPGKAKPDPAPIVEMVRRCGGGRAAFVGDSRYDVEAARAAGVPVAVYGFDATGDAAFDDYRDLIGTLERLA